MVIDSNYIQGLIRQLNKHCFTAGISEYTKRAGLKPPIPGLEGLIDTLDETQKAELARCVNSSMKSAQEIIIENRLAIEDAAKRGDVSYVEPYNPDYALRLLTDYADTIAWSLLGLNLSAVRNFHLEPKGISPLEPQNWAGVERVLSQLNKNPDEIAIATDLTSFLHIGDVYSLNTAENSHNIHEVKDGKMNAAILEPILDGYNHIFEHGFGPSDTTSRLLSVIKQSNNPPKTAKQVLRVMRQELRILDSSRYYLESSNKRERVDINTRQKIKIDDDGEEIDWWSVAVNKCVKKIKSGGTVDCIVDGCLYFAYGKKRPEPNDLLFARIRVNEVFGLGLSPDGIANLPVFNSILALGQGIAQPRSLLFMSHLGQARQRKLLSGEEFLLVYLNPKALQKIFKGAGLKLVIQKMRKEDQAYRDPLQTQIFGENKLVAVKDPKDNSGDTLKILGGTWVRVLFGFMPPSEVFNMARSYFDSNKE